MIPHYAPTLLQCTKTDDDPTSFTPVRNEADLVAIQTYGKDAAITPKKLDFVEKRDLQSSKSGRRLVRSASP
jgi:hypothetical protein